MPYPRDVSDTRTSYHHGALREALMAACLHLIETEGIGAVSLRAVARAAGVSSGAPYHHFADRAALLAALSTHGFEILATQLVAARDAADSPIHALTALTRAYVTFAHDQPAYFQLMFRPELSQPDKHPDTAVAGDAALAVLAGVIADCVRAGVVANDDADAVAMGWWSLSHGLAALGNDGQLAKQSAKLGTTADILTDRITQLFETLLLRS